MQAAMIVGGVVLLLAVLVVLWRWTSVGRGQRFVDGLIHQLLGPLDERLHAGEAVSAGEVRDLAHRAEVRGTLYDLLRQHDRLDLFPDELLTTKAEAEACLAYWMMHPNELRGVAECIEFIEEVVRPISDREASFFVFRYRMPPGHWAAEDGWLLGVSGPFLPDVRPYESLAGAFARVADRDGEITAGELVDRFIRMFERRGGFSLPPADEPSVIRH